MLAIFLCCQLPGNLGPLKPRLIPVLLIAHLASPGIPWLVIAPNKLPHRNPCLQDLSPLTGAEVVFRVENKMPSHDQFAFHKLKGGLLRAGRYILEWVKIESPLRVDLRVWSELNCCQGSEGQTSFVSGGRMHQSCLQLALRAARLGGWPAQIGWDVMAAVFCGCFTFGALASGFLFDLLLHPDPPPSPRFSLLPDLPGGRTLGRRKKLQVTAGAPACFDLQVGWHALTCMIVCGV